MPRSRRPGALSHQRVNELGHGDGTEGTARGKHRLPVDDLTPISRWRTARVPLRRARTAWRRRSRFFCSRAGRRSPGPAAQPARRRAVQRLAAGRTRRHGRGVARARQGPCGSTSRSSSSRSSARPRPAPRWSAFRFEAQVAGAAGAEDGPHRRRARRRQRPLQRARTSSWVTFEVGPPRQLMQERGPISPAELAPLLGHRSEEALSVAHGLGIVHRDIKPTNVLLEEERSGEVRAKVADFGIAKWIRKELPADFPRRTIGGVVLGTPAYLEAWSARLGDGDFNPHWTWPGRSRSSLHEALYRKPAALPGPHHERRARYSILASGATASGRRCTRRAPPALSAWFARAFALNPTERFPRSRPWSPPTRQPSASSGAPARAERAEPARRGGLGPRGRPRRGARRRCRPARCGRRPRSSPRCGRRGRRARRVRGPGAARARIVAQASPRPAARSGDAAPGGGRLSPRPRRPSVPAAAPRPSPRR